MTWIAAARSATSTPYTMISGCLTLSRRSTVRTFSTTVGRRPLTMKTSWPRVEAMPAGQAGSVGEPSHEVASMVRTSATTSSRPSSSRPTPQSSAHRRTSPDTTRTLNRFAQWPTPTVRTELPMCGYAVGETVLCRQSPLLGDWVRRDQFKGRAVVAAWEATGGFAGSVLQVLGSE
jgi:hypothetical protein